MSTNDLIVKVLAFVALILIKISFPLPLFAAQRGRAQSLPSRLWEKARNLDLPGAVSPF